MSDATAVVGSTDDRGESVAGRGELVAVITGDDLGIELLSVQLETSVRAKAANRVKAVALKCMIRSLQCRTWGKEGGSDIRIAIACPE